MTLSNGNQIFGKYEGMDMHQTTSIKTELVLIKEKKKVKPIPLGMITKTEIYFIEKNRSRKGLLVGLSIDVAIIVALVANGGMDLDINLNWQ